MNAITFGRPDSWEHFANSHPLFFERFPHLKTAEEVAFIREVSLSTRADKVVFFIGKLCVEDFNETGFPDLYGWRVFMRLSRLLPMKVL